MTRRTKRQHPPQRTPAPTPSAPVRAPAEPARWLSLAEQTALTDPRTLSLRQAETYRTDPRRYTSDEREQVTKVTQAQDFAGDARNSLTFIENTSFPGFPTLALLAQLAEYRTMHETLADETIRMWGKVVSSGDAAPEKLKAIEEALKRIDMRAVVRQLVIHDQAFGRSHAYVKLKGDEDVGRELPLLLTPRSVQRGAFEGLRVVEAFWVTPNNYNSIDPTRADFYKPSSWWMLGVETHATRLQTLISRPVADMLKPTYSFGGVSMTQLAMPYVDNWLRTRQSVSDAVKQFAVSGIKTDLQQYLAPGGATDLQARAQLLNNYRDNRNLLFLDMAQEEYFMVATPLSGLHELQAQAQEQMSAVSHIPLVKLLGLTPTGLNASSEGEIRVFYDYVRGYQSNVLTPLLNFTIKLIQLSEFGELDESISWKWEALLEMTALEQADARAKDADTDTKYLETGVLSPEQVAKRLDTDEHSLYTGLLSQAVPLDEIPDDDIQAITEHIAQIGENDETAAHAGQEAQGLGADPTGSRAASGLPAAPQESRGEHGGELPVLAPGEVQRGLAGASGVQPIARPREDAIS